MELLTLKERAAKALGWTLQDVNSVSYQALRDLLQPTHPKLAYLFDDEIKSGRYIARDE